jgi:molybdopterin molybdotransferase
MKPGKPVILGELNNKYVLGLPGNPLSVITSFEVVGIPVIKKIMNYKQCCRKWFNVKTNSDIYKTDKRLLFLNGKIVYKNNEPEFIPKHFKTSADLINSGESDGLGLIEKNVIKKDEYIKFISLNIL